uniref:(northern house mosquito) hypothetical protein n=1 Tax=Culex pipiens TaxID=7175 RepID=A0A8D8JKH2_CULPI
MPLLGLIISESGTSVPLSPLTPIFDDRSLPSGLAVGPAPPFIGGPDSFMLASFSISLFSVIEVRPSPRGHHLAGQTLTHTQPRILGEKQNTETEAKHRRGENALNI